MAMNPIQFQAGLSLLAFQRQYGSEAQCEQPLFASRWPQGWRCARCSCKRCFKTRNGQGRQLWECLICGYQCSSIVGTVFEHTRLPLRVWLLALYLLTQNKGGISALALKRQLGVSYKTAWLVKHKLMQTMLQREATRRLDERVEIDDAYLGGERAGHIHGGRGAYAKSAFVAAVQTTAEGRPRFLRLTPIAGFTNAALKTWAAQNLALTAHVVSDGLRAFAQVLQVGASHERHVTAGGRQATQRPELRWINTMLGNLKMALSGTYHAFDHAKYGARYLAKFAYRFNRRYDMVAMLPRLLRAAVTTRPLPLKVIRMSETRDGPDAEFAATEFGATKRTARLAQHWRIDGCAHLSHSATSTSSGLEESSYARSTTLRNPTAARESSRQSGCVSHRHLASLWGFRRPALRCSCTAAQRMHDPRSSNPQKASNSKLNPAIDCFAMEERAMILFIVGLGIFLGIHSVAIVAPEWRNAQVARNEGAWKGIYSVVSVVGLVLLVYGYRMAQQATPFVWFPPTFMRHIALLVMLPVFPLLFAAYFPGRIKQVAKHPMLLAVKFWALAHLLANGSLVDIILFGAFLAWAVADQIAVNKRPVQRVVPGAPPSRANDAIALIGGLAIYAAFLIGVHRWLIGVSPLM